MYVLATDTAWVAPVAAVVVAAVTGFFAWYVPAWKIRRDSRIETANALRHTRDPLLRAGFDLQSRYYNIVARGFLARYLINGDEDERAYALMSTLWLIGQYLGWVEILRREVQYLDLGSRAANRQLQLHLTAVASEMASDSQRLKGEFVIFRADQRAIGEFMVISRATGRERASPTLDCLGYSEFLAHIRQLERSATGEEGRSPVLAWVRRFQDDLLELGRAAVRPENARLTAVQRSLIDLVNLLDPEQLRYPELNFRGKLPDEHDIDNEPPSITARFLWERDDPWQHIDQWVARRSYVIDYESATRRKLHGRAGLTGLRPMIELNYGDGWLDLKGMVVRRKTKPINGSLRLRRARSDFNEILFIFSRPQIADATLPARAATGVVALISRLLRGTAIRGS